MSSNPARTRHPSPVRLHTYPTSTSRFLFNCFGALCLPLPAILGQSTTNAVVLQKQVVVGSLDVSREQIVPSLGASAYAVSSARLDDQIQGANSPFNQVLLRTPSVAQDSYGQVHLRGEHANLQYRINDVLLPEGLGGFGQELDTRFVDQLQVIAGTLPAQFGFRTAGVIDIHTRSGAYLNGGEVSLHGGSHDSYRPGVEYGGSSGNLNYYVTGSYAHTGLGLENPTSSADALHDVSNQYRGFGYFSYVLDETSRLSWIVSGSAADFQIPNVPGQSAGADPAGTPFPLGGMVIDSTRLDENQSENNAYAVLAYQKSADRFGLQAAGFVRSSGIRFRPDRSGDLYFDGVAAQVDRRLLSAGLQLDSNYELTDQHTLRAGAMFIAEHASLDSVTSVFPIDAAGHATGNAFDLSESNRKTGSLGGIYLQDEWHPWKRVTLNIGGRLDVADTGLTEWQLSPRANLVWEATPSTTAHLGYARYFTPPSLDRLRTESLAAFANTSNAPEIPTSSPVRAERTHSVDVGITQKLLKGLSVGVDTYGKWSRNQLDDGFFGPTLIPASFNFREGRIYGVEGTVDFNYEGFSCFGNVAWSRGQGRELTSGEFLFSAADAAFLRDHWTALDHDQRITASAGAAYGWNHTRFFVDALYGSGLRRDLELPGGASIPNGATVPQYATVNLGVEQRVPLAQKRELRLRVETVNLADATYVLRDGTGIGVNAAQYGARFGVFGSASLHF